MGIPETSCKCLKTCKDLKEEINIEKEDFLRTKASNHKINNESRINNFQQSKGFSINSVSGKTEIITNSRDNNISNRNNDNNIKETLENPIVEVTEENKYINTNNNILISANSINNKDKDEEKIEEEKEIEEKNENDSNNNSLNSMIESKKSESNSDKESKEEKKQSNVNSIIISEKEEEDENIDTNIFFTETLKKAEKYFDSPLDYEKDWRQYNEDDENEEIPNLINKMNSNQGENKTKEEGEIIDFKGKKCFYKGQLDDNQNPCGFGVLYTQNGEKYEGNFYLGGLLGLGRYINEEGTCFEGIFKNNKLVSKAKVINWNEKKNQKIYYFGEVSNFIKHGKGQEITKEYRYSGDFVDNEKHGNGIIEFVENEELYEGEFNQNEITGKGLYIWSNKNTYKGDFVKGIKQGKGKYKWPDGTEYEGDYNNGEREGYGTYKWVDGREFTGRFKGGVPDGKGKLTYKGKCVNIEYKNGKPIQDIKKLLKES